MWFTNKELQNLYKIGYKIYRFEIDKSYIKFGNKQLVFNKDKNKNKSVLIKLEHKNFYKLKGEK